jgi:hypothetical protein
MKITYMFTATGKYSQFIPELVSSANKNFFPNDDVDFIVFSDSEEYNKIERLKVIKTEKMGWPFDTLKRFHLINSIENILTTDFLFYGNANMIFNSEISHEILPSQSDNWMVGAIHPCFYNAEPISFPYERNNISKAFVDYGDEGDHYYQEIGRAHV